MRICPPLERLYTQLDDLRPDSSQRKVILHDSLLEEFEAPSTPQLSQTHEVSAQTPGAETDAGTEFNESFVEDGIDASPDTEENSAS